MSKLGIGVVALVASSIVAVAPVDADPGCKNGKFVGTYTQASLAVDVFGDGSVFHTFVNVLSLHGDGTAEQYFTGIPDYMINAGSGTPQFGSWGCRTDGRLVVSFLAAGFQPVAPGTYPLTPYADIEMAFYRRSTYLFMVTDDNTLTRVRARNRGYVPDQDPTDPAGGTLGPITTTPLVYKRLAASDADLLP